ncbi:hypothetical protein INP83_12150 [Mucilaginibacter sp. 21P]|uniref:hypothetical protein n=1 Tax=Mucilaginibacter sp. 21P TaxID=2778902 RepID=UPI001C581CF1|nr:hypothetical protein [Mucilaginibacter sp. 21P]QXV63857.1 hypothetical protein INP83_12150 [Mucilaginibacter sp. 21P]
MYVPKIIELKKDLENLKLDGLVADWEIPFENLLTRLSAAIVFVSLNASASELLFKAFEKFENFSYRINSEKKLSALEYRLTFNLEEKEKNESVVPGNALASQV